MAREIRIDGLRVLEREPVESPLSTPERPIYFTRILRLLLEDGSELFGCGAAGCEEVRETVQAVSVHLGVEHPDPEKARIKSTDPLDMTLREVTEVIGDMKELRTENIRLTRENDRLKRDRNEWKARAKDAESDLTVIRNAIRGKK